MTTDVSTVLRGIGMLRRPLRRGTARHHTGRPLGEVRKSSHQPAGPQRCSGDTRATMQQSTHSSLRCKGQRDGIRMPDAIAAVWLLAGCANVSDPFTAQQLPRAAHRTDRTPPGMRGGEVEACTQTRLRSRSKVGSSQAEPTNATAYPLASGRVFDGPGWVCNPRDIARSGDAWAVAARHARRGERVVPYIPDSCESEPNR